MCVQWVGFCGRQQKIHARRSHIETRWCVQVEDELNISPGLLCCCGSVWEERRTGVSEHKQHVAMVSTRLEGYYRSVGGGDYLSGEGGGPSRCPSLSPGNRSPPPFIVLTQWVSHSLIYQSLSLFLSLLLACFSVTHSATTHFRFAGRMKGKWGQEWVALRSWSCGKEGSSAFKTGQSLQLFLRLLFPGLSSAHQSLPFPSATLCYVICLLPLSSVPPHHHRHRHHHHHHSCESLPVLFPQ